jgi:uncharacterized membrane protein YozB (DUF420 family)
LIAAFLRGSCGDDGSFVPRSCASQDPAKLGKAYYALATAHGALGTVTELAGLYILLSAGSSVLRKKLRITKYKVWMRSVLALWWVVLLLGMATYTRWYVPHLFRK